MGDDKDKSLADKLRAKKEAEKAGGKHEPSKTTGGGLKAGGLAKKPGGKHEPAKTKSEGLKAGGLAKKPGGKHESAKTKSGGLKAGGKHEPAKTKSGGLKAGGLAGKAGGKHQPAQTAETLSAEAVAELSSKISGLKRDYNSLVGRVKLSSIARETANLGTGAAALPDAIQTLRDRGYAFRSYLERKAQVLAEQWEEVDGEIKRWIEEESDPLQEQLDRAQGFVERIDAQTGASAVLLSLSGQLESVVGDLENRVQAAENHVRGMYDALRREINQTNRQVKEITEYLDLKDEASFDFTAGESVFLVAEAEWDDGRDKPEGLFFLTDRRLVFEQKEKVGGRFGFGGDQVHKMLWETPVNAVENVEPENKGLLGGKDMLHLSLGAGAPYAKITVEVKGDADNKFWAKQIERMAKGEFEDERAIEPDADLIKKLRNAPTECHVCGGMFPQITGGETQVECKYCGAVVRL